MAVRERERERRMLAKNLEDRLGEETGNMLMEQLPPAVDDLATKHDVNAAVEALRRELQQFRADMLHRFDLIDERFKAIDERFKGIDERFKGVDHRIESVRHELSAQFQSGLNSQLKWMLTAWVASLASIAAIIQAFSSG